MSHHKEKYLDSMWVLAMINEMIEESIYHTERFAYSLKAHHNDNAAKVFDRTCEKFKAEQSLVLNYTLNVDLPNIPPWEIPYSEYKHPALLLLDAHYQMSEEESSKIVTAITDIHQKFYMILHNESSKKSVIDLADQLVNGMKD